MAFHETRLPEDVERGAEGGPAFNTTILALNSGFEQRNQNWEAARGRWNIGYGIQTKSAFDLVKAFFYARRGRFHGFRFKDWSDYEIGDSSDSSTRQTIGVGDASNDTFQIYKRYSDGGEDYDRTITKPVNGTLLVYLDGVLQTETTNYTVDYTTGIITFTSPPGGSVVVAVICEFDVPVRFDTDNFGITLATFDAGSIPDLPVVELRV